MADAPKSHFLSPEIHAYLVGHGTPPDPLLRELREETATLGPRSIMQVAPEQGAFLTVLTRLIGARRAIEVGTFTGYSAICIARGLPQGGELLCCDINEETAEIAQRYFEKAGLASRITQRIAPATDTLRALPPDEAFDLAFIDADKVGYPVYYEECLARLRPGGAILVDNVLWGGSVADPDADDVSVRAIRAFNDAVAADDRVDCVMIPLSDGLTILRKR